MDEKMSRRTAIKNNCPQKAIKFAKVDDDPLLANGEKNPEARYRNEHISVMGIKRANSKNAALQNN